MKVQYSLHCFSSLSLLPYLRETSDSNHSAVEAAGFLTLAVCRSVRCVCVFFFCKRFCVQTAVAEIAVTFFVDITELIYLALGY